MLYVLINHIFWHICQTESELQLQPADTERVHPDSELMRRSWSFDLFSEKNKKSADVSYRRVEISSNGETETFIIIFREDNVF